MATAEPVADFVSLDIGTLRNYLDNHNSWSGLRRPVYEAMTAFLAGTASDEDRLLLGNWAATHGDAYPRTCEALVRELERTAT